MTDQRIGRRFGAVSHELNSPGLKPNDAGEDNSHDDKYA
jgi:hypothetical protein